MRREAACCPFLSYEVDLQDDQILWTTSGGLGASDMAVLDEFLTGAAESDSKALAEQLEARSGIPVIVPTHG